MAALVKTMWLRFTNYKSFFDDDGIGIWSKRNCFMFELEFPRKCFMRYHCLREWEFSSMNHMQKGTCSLSTAEITGNNTIWDFVVG